MLASKKIIAFDESGNTGSRLLDKDQPIFILNSINLTSEEADELSGLIKTPASELKFNRLKKYSKYHSQLAELLNSPLISKDTVSMTVFHKEYSVFVHTIDRLIEPVLYNDGIDVYQDGLNIALTNLLFYCTPTFCGEELCTLYKHRFIDLFYKRDVDSIEKFGDVVEQMMNKCTDDFFRTVLAMIMLSGELIGEILDEWDNYNFDSTLTSFIYLVDYWGRKSDLKFDVYVDNSKPLKHFEHHIGTVRKINIGEQEIGADRRTLKLPLKLHNLIFEDSKNNIVVQMSDLIAGAANHYYRSLIDAKYEDNLSRLLATTKLPSLFHHMVWPYPAFTPEQLGTLHNGKMNVLDSMTALVSRYNKLK